MEKNQNINLALTKDKLKLEFDQVKQDFNAGLIDYSTAESKLKALQEKINKLLFSEGDELFIALFGTTLN